MNTARLSGRSTARSRCSPPERLAPHRWRMPGQGGNLWYTGGAVRMWVASGKSNRRGPRVTSRTDDWHPTLGPKSVPAGPAGDRGRTSLNLCLRRINAAKNCCWWCHCLHRYFCGYSWSLPVWSQPAVDVAGAATAAAAAGVSVRADMLMPRLPDSLCNPSRLNVAQTRTLHSKQNPGQLPIAPRTRHLERHHAINCRI